MKAGFARQKTGLFHAGYKKGLINGFHKGKSDGLQQGRTDALTLFKEQRAALSAAIGNGNPIIDTWHHLNLGGKFAAYFGEPVLLVVNDMECLKESGKSAIWKLHVTHQGIKYPIILKIFHSPVEGSNLAELNMYQKAGSVMHDFMPQIFMSETDPNSGDVWVLMEYVEQLKGQIQFNPSYFDTIIPTLARMHAHTHNDKFTIHENVFRPWMPEYLSNEMHAERSARMKETLSYLDEAMKRPDLKELIAPVYPRLKKGLSGNAVLFTELIDAGQSIIHNDLQTVNIGCNNVVEHPNWRLKFLDWEGATYAPCWFDLVNLVGVFLTYRSDWRGEEENIIRHCAQLYADEMQKHGISFQTDPLRLYKMAYFQRTFERSLNLQLSWKLEGRQKGDIIARTMEKMAAWGPEMGL